MTYKPAKGTYIIDRIFRGVGRVALRTGTHDKRRALQYEHMLEDLPLDVVRLIVDGVLELRETYDLWVRGETKLLPTAQLLRPLIPTLRAWVTEHEPDVSASEQEKRVSLVDRLEQRDATARVKEIPTLLRAHREAYRGRGSQFNHDRTICMAFARDILGKRSETHHLVAEVRRLPTPPKQKRHPCTVREARAIALELPNRWGPVWWAMCCHGLGPKEYFSDGWKVTSGGLEVYGQKQPARNRVVPLIVSLPEGGTDDAFEAALYRAKVGVAPYDARRSYSRWLDELRLPLYQHNALMGHGPKSMRELYSWGEITEWLGGIGAQLREYVGEPIQLRVRA